MPAPTSPSSAAACSRSAATTCWNRRRSAPRSSPARTCTTSPRSRGGWSEAGALRIGADADARRRGAGRAARRRRRARERWRRRARAGGDRARRAGADDWQLLAPVLPARERAAAGTPHAVRLKRRRRPNGRHCGVGCAAVLTACGWRRSCGLGVDRQQAVDVLHVVDVQRAGGLFQQQAALQEVVARAARTPAARGTGCAGCSARRARCGCRLPGRPARRRTRPAPRPAPGGALRLR